MQGVEGEGEKGMRRVQYFYLLLYCYMTQQTVDMIAVLPHTLTMPSEDPVTMTLSLSHSNSCK